MLNTIALTLKTIGKYDYYDQIPPSLLKLILRVTRNILQTYWWTHKDRNITKYDSGTPKHVFYL